MAETRRSRLALPTRRSVSKRVSQHLKAVSPMRFVKYGEDTSPTRHFVLKTRNLIGLTRRQMKARGLFTGATRRKLRQFGYSLSSGLSARARTKLLEARAISHKARVRKDKLTGKISQKALGDARMRAVMRALGERCGQPAM